MISLPCLLRCDLEYRTRLSANSLFLVRTPTTVYHSVVKMSDSDPGFLAAVQEAKNGFAEGGVPIGACLVSKEGKIIGQGHNMRVQKGSATLHVQ